LLAESPLDDFLDLELDGNVLVFRYDGIDVRPDGLDLGRFVAVNDIDKLLVGLQGSAGEEEVNLLLDGELFLDLVALLLDEI
jgi:hypothetical protein